MDPQEMTKALTEAENEARANRSKILIEVKNKVISVLKNADVTLEEWSAINGQIGGMVDRVVVSLTIKEIKKRFDERL